MREWFEDEAFWEKLYPFMFSERSPCPQTAEAADTFYCSISSGPSPNEATTLFSNRSQSSSGGVGHVLFQRRTGALLVLRQRGTVERGTFPTLVRHPGNHC